MGRRKVSSWPLELSKRDTGRTLYILTSPPTGLHFADIALLLTVLQNLRDDGNTIVVIDTTGTSYKPRLDHRMGQEGGPAEARWWGWARQRIGRPIRPATGALSAWVL